MSQTFLINTVWTASLSNLILCYLSEHFVVVPQLKLWEDVALSVFSSYPDPASAPVASHRHRPPRAPCSPQPGCFYGNHRICSGPVHTVSVSSLSLSLSHLGLFSSVQPEPRSELLAAAYFSSRSLFVFCVLLFFLPGCKMEEERWFCMRGVELLCWVSTLRFVLSPRIIHHPLCLSLSVFLYFPLSLSFLLPFPHTSSRHLPHKQGPPGAKLSLDGCLAA